MEGKWRLKCWRQPHASPRQLGATPVMTRNFASVRNFRAGAAASRSVCRPLYGEESWGLLASDQEKSENGGRVFGGAIHRAGQSPNRGPELRKQHVSQGDINGPRRPPGERMRHLCD